MFGYIYVTTNLINNKKYIGRCKSKNFKGEKYLGSGLRLNEAIKKYGKQNFSVEMIDTAESDAELNVKEEYYIDFYNAVEDSNFYNLRRGGSRGPGGPMFKGHTHSEETKLKMSINRSGVKNSNYGNRWTQSDELKKLHSKLSSGKNNGMYGKHHTEESKRKNSLSNKGKRWINNGLINITCKPDKLDDYLNQGWILGMLPKKKHI